MKHFFSGMIVTLALVAVLVIGIVALAETAPEAPALPAVEDAQPTAEAPAETPAAQTDDSAALKEALDALSAARQSSKVESLENELNEYVASGKLTQEQADLILKYYKDQESLRNGVCPGCGYQFQNDGGFGKGGRMNGGKGGRGGNKGGMRGFGQQQPGANQQPGMSLDNGAIDNAFVSGADDNI